MNSLVKKEDSLSDFHFEKFISESIAKIEEEKTAKEVENLIDGEYYDVSSEEDVVFMFYD